MRRFEKKIIYDLLDKLTDIHKKITEEYKAGQMEAAITLLCKCQDSAVSIGNLIENREGENCPSVKYLERYCDCLYNIGQNIVSKTCTKKDFDDLRRQRHAIRQNIKKDITSKLEIVFLPYKASMWGSLESIWQTAQDDPDCDAFVIPIPYFDRKPDRSLGDMHYEGDQFPGYVPITHYTNYDLSIRKPDAVFIHNPYDGNNYVTTVAPQYYSTSLKAHTDCLIYVPYFTFASIDSIKKHFFIQPGVLNADYVITQSEEIRNAYIDAHEEFTGMKGDEKRFLALGSPMLDKVISTKRKDISIPNGWNDVIADKKVMLYNTSIKGILDQGEKALVKMDDVFRTFQEQDNIVLLWRPHPLNYATISSMNPTLLNKYEMLIEQFKKNNWGIYDDTSDVYRAIALSDAYYGDAGSLLPMFGITGRPVLVQKMLKTGYQKSCAPDSISFDNWVREGSTAWFSAANFNGLIEVDLETMHTNILAKFPIQSNKNPRVISGFTKCNSQLVFAASEQDYLFCYDLSDHTMSRIHYHLPSSFTKYNDTYLHFWAAHSFKDDVYFFGHKCPAILKLNMSNKKVNIITDWLPEIERLTCNSKEAYLTVGLQYSEKYYAPCCRANAVVELDLLSGSTNVIEVPNSGKGFSGIAFDGDKFWLSPRNNGPIISWNKETDETKEYRNYPGSEENSRLSFHPIFYQNGFIWLAPVLAEKTLKISCHDGSIYEVTELDEICSQENKNTPGFPRKFMACHPGDGSVLWFNDGAYYSLIRFDTSDGSIQRFNLMTPDTQEQFRAQKGIFNFLVPQQTSELSVKDIYEGKNNQLRDYLYYIANYTNEQSMEQIALFKKIFANVDGSCGKKTYRTIKTALNQG